MWGERAHHKHGHHHDHVPSGGSKDRQPKFIADNYSSVDEVVAALREAGLESSNLILGIDFTKSNEWSGRHSFGRKSLHAISGNPNPYEQAISIIGLTLSPFDDDNLIPCFGFGDATTHDHSVFSFYQENRPCRGFEEVLDRYRQIVPHLNLSDMQGMRADPLDMPLVPRADYRPCKALFIKMMRRLLEVKDEPFMQIWYRQ